MPPGKMLMGTKVKDGFYYFFVRVKIISYLVGQENFDIFTQNLTLNLDNTLNLDKEFKSEMHFSLKKAFKTSNGG